MPRTLKKTPKTLYLLSYGMKLSHITAETLGLMGRCDAVYTTVFDGALEAAFGEKYPALHKKLRLIAWKGQAGMNAEVLGAFKKLDTVGFLTFGNPALLNGNLNSLAAAAERGGVRAVYADAVSTLDTIINLFRLNLERELRIIDAGRLGDGSVLDPAINTLFFSIDRLNLKGEEARKRRFLAKISGAYQPGSAAYLVACCLGAEGESQVVKVRTGALEAALEKVSGRHTLLIPAYSSQDDGRSNFDLHKAPDWLERP